MERRGAQYGDDYAQTYAQDEYLCKFQILGLLIERYSNKKIAWQKYDKKQRKRNPYTVQTLATYWKVYQCCQHPNQSAKQQDSFVYHHLRDDTQTLNSCLLRTMSLR
jgi:hypothetical protein